MNPVAATLESRLGIQLVVTEPAGIRRFLYPMRVQIPSVYRRSAARLALAEASGKLIPSHIADLPGEAGLQCSFALSIGPRETRELFLVRLEPGDRTDPPDPLQIVPAPEGIVTHQDRVSFAVDSAARLTSVMYDGVEHLAGPVTVALDGDAMAPDAEEPATRPQRRSPTGLYVHRAATGTYRKFRPLAVEGRTITELSACKSWAVVRHALSASWPGARLVFTVPLTATSAVQTCDFGMGNGAYTKLQQGSIDQVVWDIDLSQRSAAFYRVRVRQEGTGRMRTDYAGEVRSAAELPPKLWLHWVEARKSLALAITQVAKGCDGISIRVSRTGVAEVEFVLGEFTASPAEFAVCAHFLNDAPAIAAATSPASILTPPKPRVARAPM